MASLSRTIVRDLDIDMLFDKKARSSFCWKYFGNIVRIEDGKRKMLNPEQVYCSACLKNVQEESDEVFFGSVKIRCYSRRVSTGNLIRHLRDDHDIREESYMYYKPPQIIKIEPEENPTQTCTASSSECSIPVINDKWQLAKDLALWFSKSLLPFDSVSDEGMVDFFKKYNIIHNENDLPSRNSVGGSALFNVHECILTNVKEVIRLHVPRHCSITFELWTDRYRKLNYITFILQYLTTDFELKSLTLSTEILREKATRESISDLIKDMKNRFGFEGKNIHAVINASSNFKRATTFESMDHHLCLGHGLHNLVIVDGIQSVSEIHELVKKCKKIVLALCYRLGELEFDCEGLQRGLIGAIERVAESLEMDERDEMRYEIESAIANEDVEIVTSEDFPKDVTPTRWHIVLEMLDFFINVCNRETLNDMLKRIDQEILAIKQNEWSILEDLIELLSKFRGVVEILSYQKTCTINVGLVFRAELKDVLKSHCDDESSIVSRLKHNMLMYIDRRFPVSKLLIAAALLDKRFMRLREVDSYLESRNLTKVTFLTSYIKELIQSDDLLPDTMKSNSESSSGPTTNTTSMLSKLSKKHSVSDGTEDPIEQECWRYFALGSPDLQSDDLLPFWKENKNNFPWLSSFARALLCIPATSTPSDRIFSIDGLNFTAKRSRLDPFRMNKIIFIHDNYKINKVTADE